MIPYEELVIALQTWRAKQGLPVGQLSGALTPPPLAPPAPPAPVARTAPPVAPPQPAPAFDAQADEPLDVDDGALLEETSYDADGDYAMSFGAGVVADGESTTIGGVPQPDSTLDQAADPASGRHRNDEW